MLVLSPFAERYRSATAGLAVRRNQFVAALSDAIFVVHAAAGSKTEQLCRELLDDKRRLLALDREENRNLLDLGATVGNVEQIVDMLATAPLGIPQCVLADTARAFSTGLDGGIPRPAENSARTAAFGRPAR